MRPSGSGRNVRCAYRNRNNPDNRNDNNGFRVASSRRRDGPRSPAVGPVRPQGTPLPPASAALLRELQTATPVAPG